jgi:hypothetical protein
MMDYEARLEQLRAESLRESVAASSAVQMLFAMVAGAAMILWVASQTHSFPAWLALVTLIPVKFVWTRMGKAQRRANELRRLTAFYKRVLARQSRAWIEDPETGEEYEDTSHLYSADLDLFGRGSLFQFLCIARTGTGRDALARYMTELADEPEAKARTAAVEELRGRTDLREGIAAAGPGSISDCRTETFVEWVRSPSRRISSMARSGAFILSLGAPILAVVAVIRVFPTETVFQMAATWVAMAAAFSQLFRERVTGVIADIGLPSIDLAVLSDMIGVLEQQEFTDPKLRSLTAVLKGRNPRASHEIARLRRLLKFLEVQKWLEPVTWLFLWNTQFAMAIENWRVKHAADMQLWLNTIGEFEALNAVSAYAFDHPEDARAEFVDGPPVFEAVGLGHPLIELQTCVRNDVHLGDGVPLWIISGSNMSGKSTLLRACGLAVVLASMGAPVRAHRLRISNLTLAAAIRIQDSLLDGKSKFFVEVERLKNIIDLADRSHRLLFLVDEILSGTNSQDRRTASEAVIRALLERDAIGLLTTHDLALTQIVDEEDIQARNVHLADSGDSGGLAFDYTLKPGVIQKPNALAIVELLGIPLGKSTASDRRG